MKILNLKQGTPEWDEHRANHYNASEAPAMLGLSPHTSRADLLRQKATGVTPEVSPQLQRVFDKGHEAEAAMRPKAEEIVGAPLFPATVEHDDGVLSASLDGMTMDRSIIWEHKQANQEKMAHVREYDAPPECDYPQIQQQLLITGASRCLYTVGNDPTDFAQCWVELNKGAVEDILAGWERFNDDRETYQPPAAQEQPVAKAIASMPYLDIAVQGQVTSSTLPQYREAALAVLENINTDLSTDQDFADAAEVVKWCKTVESKIEDAKAQALSQTASIEELFRTLDDLRDLARSKRLDLNKQVQQRKREVREEIVKEGIAKFNLHVGERAAAAGITRSVDAMCDRHANVAEITYAIKGKRSFQAMREAVDQVVTNQILAFDKVANNVAQNVRWFDALDDRSKILLPDITDDMGVKPHEDFKALIRDYIRKEEERIEAMNKARKEAKAAAQEQKPEPPTPPPRKPKPAPDPAAGKPSKRMWDVTIRVEANPDLDEDGVRSMVCDMFNVCAGDIEVTETLPW